MFIWGSRTERKTDHIQASTQGLQYQSLGNCTHTCMLLTTPKAMVCLCVCCDRLWLSARPTINSRFSDSPSPPCHLPNVSAMLLVSFPLSLLRPLPIFCLSSLYLSFLFLCISFNSSARGTTFLFSDLPLCVDTVAATGLYICWEMDHFTHLLLLTAVRWEPPPSRSFPVFCDFRRQWKNTMDV